jgi:hypothetical protein
MPEFNQRRAISLMRKYKPQTLEDIAKLSISEDDKNLMHSQFKVDFVYNDAYNASKKHGSEFYNEQSLISQYGYPSFSREEIDKMIQIENMTKALNGGMR